MGFFDKLFKVIGFDEAENSEEFKNEEKLEEEVEKEDIKKIPTAKYNLKGKKQEIKTYFPQTQSEVNEVVEYFVDGEDVKIDLSKIDEENKSHVLDFVSGAVFALKGEIKKIDESLYLMRH